MIKRIFSLYLFAFSIFYLFSDDTYIEVSSGTMSNVELKNNNQVQMISENIQIVLEEEYYQINVDFTFYNNGPTKEFSVGFPQWQRGTRGDYEFIDFKTSVNGKKIQFSEVKSNTEIKERYILITKWFVRNIIFAEKQNTITNVSYKVPYGSYGHGAEYLFGTGSTWKNNINTINIEIINNTLYWINEVQIDGFDILAPKNENGKIELVLHNIKPKLSDEIFIDINTIPKGLVTNRIIDPKNWYYRSRLLTQEELIYLSSSQLRILRNLIFAGNGNIFDSKDINDWLNKYCSEWYLPSKKINIDELSDTERQNVLLIQTEENRRKI